mmetsp:Transcript_33165/g.56195  ORF Transcript_33165/g.56195 Transcript_33165/m.56195 type:complete len:118 (-) Transcript_33165:863-1216(-)
MTCTGRCQKQSYSNGPRNGTKRSSNTVIILDSLALKGKMLSSCTLHLHLHLVVTLSVARWKQVSSNTPDARNIAYCSSACQKEDWKNHKQKWCKPGTRERQTTGISSGESLTQMLTK